MKKLKKIFAVAVGIMCLLTPVSVNAEEANVVKDTAGLSIVEPYTEGLIMDCTLSFTGGDKKVCITAQVVATDEMYKLGFKDMAIQRSSTGSNWATEKSLDDDIVKNAEIHGIDRRQVDVKGGNYYRFKCTFYAKEKFLFGKTQDFEYYSPSIYVS